jgi:hypothetical protein
MVPLALIRNRALAALFGAFAGAGWMLWSLAFVGSAPRFWSPIVIVLALTILSWSISKVRFVRRRVGASLDLQSSDMFGWAFRSVVACEFLLAGGSVLFLISTHRAQMIPMTIAVIVGLHFLPLAKIFRIPTLYVTGISLVLIAVVSLAIPEGNIRNIIICAGIGLSMCMRSLVALRQVISQLNEIAETKTIV